METKPNYDRAATLAVRTLIELEITCMPIFPWFLIPRCKNTALLTYDDLAKINGITQAETLQIMEPAKDAVTLRYTAGSADPYYIIAYNNHITTTDRIRFTLAHELGHRVLGHNSGSEKWEEDEANHFAMHLLFPRPLLAECFSQGMQPFEMNLYNLANCSIPCINTLQYCRSCTVPAKYNRQLRAQFVDHVQSLYYWNYVWTTESEKNPRVMLGHYMDGYEE